MTTSHQQRSGFASTDPVDVHVGSRVRLRRKWLGMSQVTLAKAIDLTFQQVQKYERGKNRISASKLYKIGQVLKAPVGYFFEGYGDGEGAECPPEAAAGLGVDKEHGES
jgi:transcriptional regulator with XRE-family HTH domain